MLPIMLLLAAAQGPQTVGLCTFTPNSQTMNISWATYGPTYSDLFEYQNLTGGPYCYVPRATSGSTWLTQLTPNSGFAIGGSGDGDVSYVPLENVVTTPRTGYISLGLGFTLTVHQTAYPTVSCLYSPSTYEVSVPSGGFLFDNIQFFASTPANHDGCIIYAASTASSWITINSPTTNQAIPSNTFPSVAPSFTVSQNFGTARRGYVALAKNLVITVNQAAAGL